jgi:hypothetical protein
VIRTFLNYFLEKDLEHAHETEPSSASVPPDLSSGQRVPRLAREASD